mgnify:FL=1
MLSAIFLIISSLIFCKSLPSTLFFVKLWDFALIFNNYLRRLIESWDNLKFVSLILCATTLNKHFIKGASCGFWTACFGISVRAFSLCCQCFEKNCLTVSSSKYSIITEASAALFPLIYSGGPISNLLSYTTWDYYVFILFCNVGIIL